MDGKLLTFENKGASALEQLVGKPIGKLVNVAARQHGLSQRVAKLYLVLAWRAPVGGAQAELGAARAVFSAALDLLTKAPETTAQIKETLDQTRNQWVFYDAALTLKAGESAAPERCQCARVQRKPLARAGKSHLAFRARGRLRDQPLMAVSR